jgi:DMSO/TMAO reductase YedYZ molybdopterin-dependent catalytic subunit
VSVQSWRLQVEGAVRRPLLLDYNTLRRMATSEIEATIDCTGGWYSAQIWRGVPLIRLLDRAGLEEAARSVTIESISGYDRRFSLEEAETLLLALDVAGKPLDHGHGFPIRLVAADKRGFNWVKWIGRIGINQTPADLQLPLPLE